MGIKQKAVKIIKVLVNKADSGARIKQLKKALLHYLCSKAFFLAYEIRVLLAVPHRYQTKVMKYPLNKIFYLSIIIYDHSAHFFHFGEQPIFLI